MTIKQLINTLSQYPEDFDLSQIKVSLSIEKVPCMNRIQSAYLANHRIAGGHPWGPLIHMERQTNLNEVANSLLTGLKTSRLSEIMPYKEDGCYGGLPDNDTPLK